MTEAEWASGCFYRRMYKFVRGRGTIRQTRLYMAACCRLMEREYFDPRILHAVEAVERCADDPQAEAAANTVWEELVTSPRPQFPQTGLGGELARVIQGAWELLREWEGVEYNNANHAIADAAFLALRDSPQVIFTGGAGDAAEYCAQAIEHVAALLMGGTPEGFDLDGPETEGEIQRAIANILRDIFGNPFRPVQVNAQWLTWNGGTVPRIAREIYEQRVFGYLPVLADALEDAGCSDVTILDHCRCPGHHVRGCWLIDLLAHEELP